MSALASTAVSPYPTDGSGSYYPGRDQQIVCKRLKLVLTGQGGQTNTIGAAALGFGKLLQCSNGFDDQNNVGWVAVIDPVANVLLFIDGVPTDVTSTATYITVTGTPVIAR